MNSQPFKNIAIGVAFSPNLKANLYEAARLSLLLKAKLHLIHIGDKTVEKVTQVNNCLASFVEHQLEFSLDFQTGKPEESIIKYVENKKIELIILGAVQKEDLLTYYLGSIARKIARAAACSVLLLIKPSIHRRGCAHIVVDGMESNNCKRCIYTAFILGNVLDSDRITIVEEIKKSELSIKVKDDKTLRKANLQREKLMRKENARVDRILESVDTAFTENITIEKRAIFGKRGYSIGHFAQICRADLLIINAPKKLSLLDRIFTNDIEHILTELPTDVLILK